MRTFVAAGIDNEILDRIEEMTRIIESDPALHSPVKWVRRDAMHLTLQFLGDVTAGMARQVERSLAEIRFPPFSVDVRGVGFFPRETSPRVFWAGVTSEGFSELAREIHGRTAALGFERPARPLKPHLTLARAKGSRRLETALVEAARNFRECEFGAMVVRRFAYLESHLSPAGARYEAIAEYALGE